MSYIFHVYVVREVKASKNAPVKIGVAVDVRRRIDTLQTGNPRALEVVMTFGPMTRVEAYGLEEFFHRRFKPQRLRGEWFSGHIVKWITQNPHRLKKERKEPGKGASFGEKKDGLQNG
jgi:hypothetical protein